MIKNILIYEQERRNTNNDRRLISKIFPKINNTYLFDDIQFTKSKLSIQDIKIILNRLKTKGYNYPIELSTLVDNIIIGSGNTGSRTAPDIYNPYEVRLSTLRRIYSGLYYEASDRNYDELVQLFNEHYTSIMNNYNNITTKKAHETYYWLASVATILEHKVNLFINPVNNITWSKMLKDLRMLLGIISSQDRHEMDFDMDF